MPVDFSPTEAQQEIAVARELGVPELRLWSQIGYGGGTACATVQHAATAVATGAADVVVCYRAFNERSGRQFGQVAAGLADVPTTAGIDNGWHYPMGLATPEATGVPTSDLILSLPPRRLRPDVRRYVIQ